MAFGIQVAGAQIVPLTKLRQIVKTCGSGLLSSVGQIKLQDLTGADLDRAFQDIRGRGLSARSVQASHVAAKKVLGEAKRLWRLAVNVAGDARPPKPSAARAKRFLTWTLEQLRTFLAAVKGTATSRCGTSPATPKCAAGS